NVVLQLDLHQKKIFYSDDTNQKVPLYDIIGAGTDAAAAAPPAQRASTVDGRTVTEVRHPEGVFRKQGLVWLEYDTTGKAGFTFEEAGRDDWSVYLRDTSRNVVLQLDLHQKKIFYSDDTNQKVPLYEIESASAIGDAVMAPDSAPSPALTPAQGVNGLNVGEVRHANGSFRQQANGWAEIDAAGVAGFLFTETGRDEWSVYLKDPSRDVTIQLDLYQKQIFYSDNNNPRAPLYDIVSAAAGGGAATGGAAPQPQDTSVAGTANGSDGREIAFPTNGEIQCVKNIVGSAIAANVKWYHPNDFEQVPGSAGTFRLKAGAIPAQEDNTVATPLPGKNRSCIRADVRMTAIVRVIGAKLATSSVKITAGTLIAVGGAVACVGTKGVACPAVAAVVTSLAEGGISFIPEAVEGDFYVGAPGQVEVYGSAFDPSWRETRAWGTGKLAGERCTANSDCRNAQCGRLSASDADANNRQCCPDGRVAMMYIGNGKDYCNKMPNGSACYLNDHCASDRCANNAGGLKRGVCK
ncbi:MAG: hypothetical protein GYA66_13470, partial [Phyllobacteriaceae bacterium]|nr:hypothetical protein [Phyllobacteriaceae bacterium]